MSEETELLSLELKKAILDWCRGVLAARLDQKDLPPAPPLEGRKGGVFVTLKRHGNLRGCIGQFSFDGPLEGAIRDMVSAAAFRDPRFPPLRSDELADLDITVSILTPPTPLKSLDDVVIGRDGLFLLHPHGRGVLLPIVAEERGFSPEEFARQTSLKAGLNPEAYKDPEAKLLVFTAPAFSTDPSDNH
ncbi:MAG: AmmeMemoRadiSam system protein A [Deltaproteobacteria bacterium]|jgi:AmmeMemoRadiSam system protein A|nr:AmmeMemoRadiSam system protein A [Deltaproteobacteria bacterium]